MASSSRQPLPPPPPPPASGCAAGSRPPGPHLGSGRGAAGRGGPVARGEGRGPPAKAGPSLRAALCAAGPPRPAGTPSRSDSASTSLAHPRPPSGLPSGPLASSPGPTWVGQRKLRPTRSAEPGAAAASSAAVPSPVPTAPSAPGLAFRGGSVGSAVGSADPRAGLALPLGLCPRKPWSKPPAGAGQHPPPPPKRAGGSGHAAPQPGRAAGSKGGPEGGRGGRSWAPRQGVLRAPGVAWEGVGVGGSGPPARAC